MDRIMMYPTVPRVHRTAFGVCAQKRSITHNPALRNRNTRSTSHLKTWNPTPSMDSLSLKYDARAVRRQQMKNDITLPMIMPCIAWSSKASFAFAARGYDNDKMTRLPQNTSSFSAIV